ncbi:MAG: thiamine diphosphokinase [Bacteroidales bacterium]
MSRYNTKSHCVIVCDGEFPTHAIPLEILSKAKTIVCCDGAANTLYKKHIQPSIVIGDFDSILPEVQKAFADRLEYNPDDYTNDQTKAVHWAITHEFSEITILAATGKREDHTLGNISLLSEYREHVPIKTITNTGIFTPIQSSTTFDSYKGQQVSVFALHPDIHITSENLKYPLNKVVLDSWWKGTLNESESNTFTLHLSYGKCIVFQEFGE